MTISRICLFVAFLTVAMGASMAEARDKTITKAFSTSRENSQLEIDNSGWAQILKRYITLGPTGINRFDYAAVTKPDRVTLSQYIAGLAKIDPNDLDQNQQRAYWINFYNALTVSVVLDHFPVTSIREIKSGLFTPGPWDLALTKVDGHSLTLNNIEHDILRGNWRDPRIHYAVNCASIGCPNLADVPYTGARLDMQLENAAAAFINHPRAVSVKNGRATLSSIFDWYNDDFGDSSASAILAHIELYAGPRLKSQLAQVSVIQDYQYDWRLNAPDTMVSAP